MPYRNSLLSWIACGVLFVALGSPSAFAQGDPWEAKKTPFGMTAYGSTNVGPDAPAKSWNVLALGLFCGGRGLKQGQVYLYLYGISDERMARPVVASFDLDGNAREFTLRQNDDVVLTPVPADFVRDLLRTRSLAISVKDYESPNPDTVNMAKASTAIRSALRNCFKP